MCMCARRVERTRDRKLEKNKRKKEREGTVGSRGRYAGFSVRFRCKPSAPDHT